MHFSLNSVLYAYGLTYEETAIPGVQGSHPTDIVLVSDYVQELQRMNPERFESFLILVQGHMLANALMCPRSRKRSYQFSECNVLS